MINKIWALYQIPEINFIIIINIVFAFKIAMAMPN